MKTQTLNNKSTRRAIRICAIPFAAAFLAASASAANGTWTNDGSSLWSTVGNWSGGTVADASTFTADFSTIDINADRTVSLDSSRTIGILKFGDTTTSSAASWTLDNNSTPANILTLSGGVGGPGITVNPLGTNKKVTISTVLSSTSTVLIDGGGKLDLTAQNTFTGAVSIGTVTSGNTVNFTGRINTGTPLASNHFTVGSGANGNNTVTISGAGNSTTPTLQLSLGSGAGSTGLYVGGDTSASSGNSLTISNGAYVRHNTNSGGTQDLAVGKTSGANGNSLTVQDSGSELVWNVGQIHVGTAGGVFGSGNSFTVKDGGKVSVLAGGLNVGNGAGSYNTVSVQGARPTSGANLSVVRSTSLGGGGTNNSITVSGGASLTTRSRSGTATDKSLKIGFVAGSNDNSFIVTGKDSLWTNDQNNTSGHTNGVVIGMSASEVFVSSSGNKLSIENGGEAVINTYVLLGGVNSEFNIGDGNIPSGGAESKVTVGDTTGGRNIELSVTDAKLQFNKGRLIARQGGTLVSGSGSVQLNGAAYISTDFSSSISNKITGSGSLTKEGTGTLTIDGTASASNFYTGATEVLAGALTFTNLSNLVGGANLSDTAAVRIATGVGNFLNLPSGFNDIVGSFYINNVLQGAGTFNAGNTGGLIASGSLTVVGVPEPGAAVSLLGGLGMLLGLRRRRA